MRIIHISDPHLTSLQQVRLCELRGKRLLGYQSWYRKRRHQFRLDTLQQITAAIRAEAADLVIVSGDLVQIGLDRELREARSWLESLGSADAVLVVPGNHDCYHPESWSLLQRHFGPYLGAVTGDDPTCGYPILRNANGISIIAASSAAPSPWWAASGSLGAAQRDRLHGMLQREHDRLRVLVLHHPPLPGMSPRRKALTDAAELQLLLRKCAPQVILHGHLHRNQSLTTPHGRIFCTAPPSSVRDKWPASFRIFDVAAHANCWQIDMTLKSLVRGELVIAERISWSAPHPLDGGDSSVRPGERIQARAQ